MGFVHLHARSWFSFQRGASSPECLVRAALEHGQTALALTDWITAAGVVRFQQAAQTAGIKPIIGAEVMLLDPTAAPSCSRDSTLQAVRAVGLLDPKAAPFGYLDPTAAPHGPGLLGSFGSPGSLENDSVVLLSASNAGYATLCRLLSRADARRTAKVDSFVSMTDLEDDHTDLFLLTGGRDSFLRSKLEIQENHSALEWLKRLNAVMPSRVFVEISSHLRLGDARMVGRLINLGRVARRTRQNQTGLGATREGITSHR